MTRELWPNIDGLYNPVWAWVKPQFKLYAAGTMVTGIEDFCPEDCDLTLKDCDY